MAKSNSIFACQICGASAPKWAGRCEACGSWNSLVEETASAGPPKGLNDAKNRTKSNRIDFVPLKSDSDRVIPRRLSNIGEFDRVLGGGLVPGSATLVGGDPGIGKSTILLQVVCKLAHKYKVAYISGEEAIDQVRLRAVRLGLADAPCELASETSIRDIVGAVDNKDAPDILIIDSIQTMYVDTLDSAPGTVAQVRTSAQELIRIAKKRDIAVILVGHVTKEGTIAGPRVLEHMVDTVLYLEGDRGHQFRVLRGVKNRFGPTDEIGVFEMTDKGLMEVQNPSALFLADRRDDMSGAAVFAGLEGTRPVLVEIQALVAPTAYGTPRRAVIGWDAGRLAMILAVLEARCGVAFGNNDVYLNVAGGFRITEPAADLAVAAALLSSLTGEPVPSNCVAFGEIGLSGEVRRVSQPALRLKEALKLGFTQAIMPQNDKAGQSAAAPMLRTTEIRQLSELLPLFQAEPQVKRA
jgi:DNA repair protein RadA/Sms